MNRYHCCASCKWFRVEKNSGQKTTYHCRRLGYATNPKYQFNCWDPKEAVIKRMNRTNSE
ncbi:hypothetical protein ACJ2A9_01095 [Anaerobacillus sp. MEB173]|uniref:hypothetical protein n=1 Tax=Anaerobacillus sp. MEB173 TaxID=3383345 RepID=UPI003F8E3C96